MFAIKALEKLKDYTFKTVLDVGSGNGEHSKYFLEQGKNVTAIALNQSNIQGITYIQSDFNIQQFTDKYDLVWASHVLEHQPNTRAFIQKLFNVCSDDGIVAITVPPMKSEIVGGHLTLWNAGLLLYNIVSAGYSCKSARVLQYDYNISIIVNKEPITVPKLNWDRGDILKLKEYFPMEVTEPFDGNIKEINWHDDIKKKEVRFLIPTPDKKYYLWQLLVQIANFREMGYEQDMHIPVVYSGKEPSEILKKFVDSKELKCHFYLFKDEREHRGYAASQKPWTMYKYFEKFPERGKDVYNYLDSDVIFTQPMDFSPFMGDDVWYGSDTRSYTGVNYVRSKGEHVFKKMCEICGVSPEMIVNNDVNSIGAQYFIKNNTAELWKEIYDKSVEMYDYFLQEEKMFYARVKDFVPVPFEYKKGDEVKYKGKKYIVTKDHISTKEGTPDKRSDLYRIEHPFQKWSAEMFGTQYIALKHGHELRASNLMQFHWANHRNLWHSKPYFHNAGIVKHEPDGVNFIKLAYNDKTPFNQDIKVDVMSASYRYLELIKRTEKYFPNLIY